MQPALDEAHLSNQSDKIRMHRNILTSFFSLLAFFLLVAPGELKAQLPDYEKLSAYLNNLPNDKATIHLIIDHLERAGTDQPLEELVRWAQAGFPEFHDKNGSWHINSDGFHSNFQNSLYFYIHQYPVTDKGARYLRLIEELRQYGQFTYPLTQFAYKVLTLEELESEFYRLVKSKDPDERSRGFILGWFVADKNQDVASAYFRAIKEEPVLQPRINALGTIAMVHRVYPREIALAGLDRLLNDPEKPVRDLGGVLVRQGADFGTVWVETDLSTLLSEMLKSKDIETRRTLAMAVAKLTTKDIALYVDEKKWADDPQEKFIALVNASGDGTGESRGEELVDAWKAWWIPLIPKYMVKKEAIACG
jgi:hypothetical protein